MIYHPPFHSRIPIQLHCSGESVPLSPSFYNNFKFQSYYNFQILFHLTGGDGNAMTLRLDPFSHSYLKLPYENKNPFCPPDRNFYYSLSTETIFIPTKCERRKSATFTIFFYKYTKYGTRGKIMNWIFSRDSRDVLDTKNNERTSNIIRIRR